MTFGWPSAIRSTARAIIDLRQGNRPKWRMLDSSIATIAISFGAGIGPRVRINQSRAYLSKPGARQVATSPSVAAITTIRRVLASRGTRGICRLRPADDDLNRNVAGLNAEDVRPGCCAEPELGAEHSGDIRVI